MHDGEWTGEYYFLETLVHRFLETLVHRLKPKERAQLHKRHIGIVFQSYHC
jgi:predicted ABC-type transport system involved in lysophospholipase L1 biosynthesis ATPase subunit